MKIIADYLSNEKFSNSQILDDNNMLRVTIVPLFIYVHCKNSQILKFLMIIVRIQESL